jgi:hypothetical protein
MYYPLSQITTNLYTNGNELMYAYVNDKASYSGFYWKTSKGEYFTGKTPQDVPTQKLITFEEAAIKKGTTPNSNPILNSPNWEPNDFPIVEYPKYKYTELQTPTYSATLPTQQDYQNTEFRRYFCKKANEIIYLEISKETYDKLVTQDPQILFQLYTPFYLPWTLIGEREQVYTINRNITELTSVRQKLPMLSEYLKFDFSKYYSYEYNYYYGQ